MSHSFFVVGCICETAIDLGLGGCTAVNLCEQFPPDCDPYCDLAESHLLLKEFGATEGYARHATLKRNPDNERAYATESFFLQQTDAAQIDDLYFQLAHTWFAPSWVVRGSGPQSAIAAAMRTGVASVDPLVPFADFQTMDEIRESAFGLQRLESVLLGALAGFALLLSAVGIFGLVTQTVSERTREFGIRLALGASVGRTISAAARSGILLSAAGIAVGFVIARSAGKLFEALIYHVEATDTMTFTVVAITLLGVATLASLLPSLRIARLDPATTLREE